MKALKIILYSLLVVIIIALIAGFIIISGIKRSALPRYNGETVLSGLSGEVTVYRDERGMPHIYAKMNMTSTLPSDMLWHKSVYGRWI